MGGVRGRGSRGSMTETHPTLHGDRTTLRPVTEDDLDLLTGWFSDPEMYAWWDRRPLSREEVEEKYVGRRRPEVESFIVETDGRAIGYLQYWLDEKPAGGGLDMILLPDSREKGLGPDAARAIVRYLLDELGWERITVDPLIDNTRAIRAWEKTGFVVEREIDTEEGPGLLMVYSREE